MYFTFPDCRLQSLIMCQLRCTDLKIPILTSENRGNLLYGGRNLLHSREEVSDMFRYVLPYLDLRLRGA